MLRSVIALVITLLISNDSWAVKEFNNYSDYEERYALHCFPPQVKLKNNRVLKLGPKKVSLEGSFATIEGIKDPANVKVGVLSAIKDPTKATLRNLDKFLKAFSKAKVDFILVGGDSGYEIEDMEEVFTYLSKKTKLPIFAQTGNSEGRGQFNNSILNIRENNIKNVVNLSLTPFINVGNYRFVSIAGYHNKKFAASPSVCIYTKRQIGKLSKMIPKDDKTMVLMSHGPPLQSGKKALDVIEDGSNVGSPLLSTFLKENNIKAGIFGHILECGGRLTNLSGKKTLKQSVFSEELLVNAGSSSSMPWTLLNKKVSVGMAGIFEAKGKKFSYKVLKAK